MEEQNEQHMAAKTAIDYIEGKIDTIGRDVREMKILLQGNTFDKTDSGMIGEVADLRKRISDVERKIQKGYWLLIGLAFGAGLGVPTLLEAFLKLLKS